MTPWLIPSLCPVSLQELFLFFKMLLRCTVRSGILNCIAVHSDSVWVSLRLLKRQFSLLRQWSDECANVIGDICRFDLFYCLCSWIWASMWKWPFLWPSLNILLVLRFRDLTTAKDRALDSRRLGTPKEDWRLVSSFARGLWCNWSRWNFRGWTRWRLSTTRPRPQFVR